MHDNKLPTDQYWAGLQDHKELLTQLDDRIRSYYEDIRSTGLFYVWERSFRSYYGSRVSNTSYSSPLFESSRLTPGGKQGQKTRLKANHFRNLIRHLHQLTTQQKPNVQARASNSDYRSQSQTILANGLLDYYWREKNVSSAVRDCAELALIFGEGFVHAPWDPGAGEMYAVSADGTPIYEGDQKYDILPPMAAIRDFNLTSSKATKYVILKGQENRWDLATKYPAAAEEILASSKDHHASDEEPDFRLRGNGDGKDSDLLDLYTFYHAKTDTLKQGRLVIFLRDLVLFDGPLPYRQIPVYRMAAEQLHGTIYGYSLAFDLLGIQEGIDELHTTLMSNNKTFGIQSIHIKDTDKLQVSTIGEGMKLFKSEEPPTPIQLTRSAPEAYTYLDKLEHTAELLSGISSTVRGNPEANLKSGNALALVVSQSIQFASGLEDAVNRLVEEIGTGLFHNLKDFSQTRRIANIIGEAQRPFAKEFSAQEDLSDINRCVVEQVNPLSKTIAGRAEMANNLLQQGLITDPAKYLMVLATGQLDPVVEGPQARMLTIRAENEDLRNGLPAVAILTEDHSLHIREHEAVLGNPDAKRNPQLVQNVLNHIQEHINLARSMDPALMAILGYAPLPPAPVSAPPSGSQPNSLKSPIEQQVDTTGPTKMPSLPPGAPVEAEQAYEKAGQNTPIGVTPQ